MVYFLLWIWSSFLVIVYIGLLLFLWMSGPSSDSVITFVTELFTVFSISLGQYSPCNDAYFRYLQRYHQ